MDLKQMSISQLVAMYNERAPKPVRSFRDKATAVKRVSELDDTQSSSRIEEATSSPGFRRMSKNLGEGQETLRRQVLADQEAATAAVEKRSNKFTWQDGDVEFTPPAAGEAALAELFTPSKTRETTTRSRGKPKAGKGSLSQGRDQATAKSNRIFDPEGTIRIVHADRNRLSKRVWRAIMEMKNGMKAQDFLESYSVPKRARPDLRESVRKGAIVVE